MNEDFRWMAVVSANRRVPARLTESRCRRPPYFFWFPGSYFSFQILEWRTDRHQHLLHQHGEPKNKKASSKTEQDRGRDEQRRDATTETAREKRESRPARPKQRPRQQTQSGTGIRFEQGATEPRRRNRPQSRQPNHRRGVCFEQPSSKTRKTGRTEKNIVATQPIVGLASHPPWAHMRAGSVVHLRAACAIPSLLIG